MKKTIYKLNSLFNSLKLGILLVCAIALSFFSSIFLLDVIIKFLNLKLSLTSSLLVESIFIYGFGLLIPVIILKKFFRISFGLNFSIKNFIICILIGFTCQPLGNLLALIGSFFVKENVVSTMFMKYQDVNLLVLILTVALIPTFVEEYVFRGVLLNGLLKQNNVLVSAIFTGLMFALFHMDLQQFIYAIAFGIFFAYIYNKTHSLLSTIIIHFTINCSQLLLALNAYDGTVETNTIEISTSYKLYALVVLSVVIIPPSYFLLKQLYSRLESTSNVNKTNDCDN